MTMAMLAEATTFSAKGAIFFRSLDMGIHRRGVGFSPIVTAIGGIGGGGNDGLVFGE